MQDNSILLSAVVVVGSRRTRAQRVVDALSSQTAAGSMEIVVVDIAPQGTPQLQLSSAVPAQYLEHPEVRSFGRARAEGVRQARAPNVAFIEEHCIPAPDWAAALIEAHKDGWQAVGYAFTNANPINYLSRASFISDYGPWAHPVRHGRTARLPGNNVSYNRDVLLSLGNKLEYALSADFNVHESLRDRGLPMYLESRALAAHTNHTRLMDLLGGNFAYCRLLAASRVRTRSWGLSKRIAYGVGVLPGAPLLKLGRLLLGFRGRRSLWPALASALPVTLLCYTCSAVGESMGYLFREGSSVEKFTESEVDDPRGETA